MAELGTIEKDACSYYGTHDSKPFNGKEFIDFILNNYNFETVLDVGAGEGLQSEYFRANKKHVFTCDYNFEKASHCSPELGYDYVGDFLKLKFDRKFDMSFSSHVLEHQRNVGLFLDKVSSTTKEGGFICIIVPIRKPFITGGHLTLWNPGLLIYNLVMSGIDCSECYMLQKDYDIGILVKNNRFNLDDYRLNYDRGDLDKLKDRFPFDFVEPFNGDIMSFNTIRGDI